MILLVIAGVVINWICCQGKKNSHQKNKKIKYKNKNNAMCSKHLIKILDIQNSILVYSWWGDSENVVSVSPRSWENAREAENDR